MNRVEVMTAKILLIALVIAPWVLVGQAQAPGGQVDQPPTVSGLFALRRENLALKQQVELLGAKLTVCQGQLAPGAYQASMETLDAERRQLVADFERAHPGWTLDTKTGQITKAPAPKKDGGGA